MDYLDGSYMMVVNIHMVDVLLTESVTSHGIGLIIPVYFNVGDRMVKLANIVNNISLGWAEMKLAYCLTLQDEC